MADGKFCPRHGYDGQVVYEQLRCDCLRAASTAAKSHLELCRSVLAPLSQDDRLTVLGALAVDGEIERACR